MNANELRELIDKGPPDGNELSVIRVTITMPWVLLKVSMEAIMAEGYSSMADYFQGLVREDRLRRNREGGIIFSEKPEPTRPATKFSFIKDLTPVKAGITGGGKHHSR